MKKYLIFIFIGYLLLLSSCSKVDNTFIECLKVSCYEDLNTSTKVLYLNVYTSVNIYNPTIKETHNIRKSEIVLKDSSKYIFNNKEEDAIFYQFKIYFNDAQVSITNVTILNNDIEYIIDIGKYQLIKLPYSESLISGEVKVNNEKLTLFIHNGLDRNIYIKKISTYQSNHDFLKINNSKINDDVIFEGDTKTFDCITIEVPNNYIYVSGILKIEFNVGEKEQFIYVFYCYNKTQEVLNKRELSIA
jgi:hypothetical protein